MPKSPKQDLTGKKFGRLTVLEYVKGGKWECLCECGKICKVRTEALINERQISCGCYRIEKNKEVGRTRKYDVGDKFGSLEVLEYLGSDEKGTKYKCICHACGKITVKSGKWLKKYKSCGCLREKRRKEGMTEYKNMMRSTKTSNIIFKTEPNKNSTTKIRGVSFYTKRQCYVASIGYKGKQYKLKFSKNIDECIEARKEAEEKIKALAKKEIEIYKNPFKDVESD